MKTIEFRGKNINTGEWVYGYFKKNAQGDCYIEDENGLAITVIPETVGQFVCKDANGNDVYEGDYLWNDEDLYLLQRNDDGVLGFTLYSVAYYEYCDPADIIGECEAAGNIYDESVLPDYIYVIDGDGITFILGDMDVYKTPEEFVKAIYESGEADGYLEDLKEKISPTWVNTYYYVCGWALPKHTPGAVKCWAVEV